jgi:hypothetical protein
MAIINEPFFLDMQNFVLSWIINMAISYVGCIVLNVNSCRHFLLMVFRRFQKGSIPYSERKNIIFVCYFEVSFELTRIFSRIC